MSLLLDGVLCLALVAAAWRVTLERQPVSAAVGFIAFGLLLAIAWVRLAAVDVALTEAAVGSGITGVVLLRAAARMPPPAGPPGLPLRLCAALVSLVAAAAIAALVLTLPEPAPSLAPAVAQAMPATELGNPVTGVLMVFRALDTVLETVVVLLAVIGVWALAPERHWGHAPAPLWPAAPEAPVVFLARALVPLGVLLGLYQLWAGADIPGGKFQGAALLAAMALLLLMAGLARPPALGSGRLRGLLLAGPFVFLAVGVAGWATAGVFLGYPAGFVKPVIILVEVASTASIALALALLVLGPPQAEEGP
ncbi:hydrogenase subunit MbhD domain-containing protein [Xanthobacter sp. AM11]|uniref:hydrogenase subunit MbhD domain-containing protein n=1 Tax=Xanthobacter sp. AM11 TaxID=3380643 RepID=UPI0039BF95B6